MDSRKFFIRPNIPDSIKPLHDLAFNMWSCWDRDASRLFHRLDPQLFRKLNHNPVELMYRINPSRLKEVSRDKGFLYELKNAVEKFNLYMNYEGTYEVNGEEKPFSKEDVVAYICMEYGLHESVPIYSGGLAVLAADHLKAASDVGIEMVAFGLLYKQGYFTQRITGDGRQIEEFRENNWHLMPVREVIDAGGGHLTIEVPIRGQTVYAKVWKIDVGRVPLYLLDTNIHQNTPRNRGITNMLYDSDRRTRLEQELLLGRGSVIALKALGIKPRVYHLNEGHTAFTILERLRHLVLNKNYTLEDARHIIRYTTVFTTHTPVVEGNEHFADELIMEYLRDEVRELGMSMDDFLNLGKVKKEKMFWLPAFALRYSRNANGVSNIHASVSRSMWRDLYPTLHERELPIEGITNGVHIQSWLSLQMTELFDRYMGPDYQHRAESADSWKNIDTIPDGEVWNAHRRRKEQVVSFIRKRVMDMITRGGYCKNKIKDVEMVLNPDYLTIGVARRFAPYKRSNLILSDPDRLVSIILNKKKPVQFLFSGKAHPADQAGKDIIKSVVDFINRYPVENHMVFVEDYDINVARHLVQGVDVWLNTPQKPMEASGTSGIKAAVNGILNLSVLDGWWPEAFNGKNGWAINSGDFGDGLSTRELEANEIYDLLENDITELYYERREGELPVDWIAMMKDAMASVGRGFNMHRAIRDYLYRFYIPEMKIANSLKDHTTQAMQNIREYKAKIDEVWPRVYVKDYFTSINGHMPVSGEEITIDSYVYLDGVEKDMFLVELFYCYGESHDQIRRVPLTFVEKYQDGVAKFSGKLILEGTGFQEISVRMLPADPDFHEVYPEYVKWKE